MIDWKQPVRLKKNKREVFVVGYCNGEVWGNGRVVGPEDRWGSGGIPYNVLGQPQVESPWGEIENFDATEGLFEDEEYVATPKQRREMRELLDNCNSSPDFGAW